jgi:hypothetical protein
MLDLDQGPCAIKRLRGCSSGNEYLAVTPDGDIYPCHQFVGIEGFKMGNLSDGTFNNELKKEFAGAHIYQRKIAKSAGQDFTAAVVAMQTIIFIREIYTRRTSLPVKFRKSALSVQ